LTRRIDEIPAKLLTLYLGHYALDREFADRIEVLEAHSLSDPAPELQAGAGTSQAMNQWTSTKALAAQRRPSDDLRPMVEWARRYVARVTNLARDVGLDRLVGDPTTYPRSGEEHIHARTWRLTGREDARLETMVAHLWISPAPFDMSVSVPMEWDPALENEATFLRRARSQLDMELRRRMPTKEAIAKLRRRSGLTLERKRQARHRERDVRFLFERIRHRKGWQAVADRWNAEHPEETLAPDAAKMAAANVAKAIGVELKTRNT